MFRCAKLYLALCIIEDFEELLGLDWRREWSKENPNRLVETMLDLFLSLKFAHELLRNYAEEREFLFCDAAQVVKSPEVPTAKDLFCDEYIDMLVSEKNGNETIRMEDG